MRGIRIKLSVFEYDVLRAVLLEAITEPTTAPMVKIAMNNILKQFQTKKAAAKIRAEKKGGLVSIHY